MELQQYNEARRAFQIAFRVCNNAIGKDLENLEKQLITTTGIPLRPFISSFDIVADLGDGNFSKIYQAVYKETGKVFAVKVRNLRS